MKVFISHASADADLARQLASTLESSGFDVWDDSQILPGDNWGAKVAEALQEADAMVVLLTPESVRSPNVTREISFALGQSSYKGRVFSVIAAPPSDLPSEDIPWVLGRFPTFRLRGSWPYPEGMGEIAAALRQASMAN